MASRTIELNPRQKDVLRALARSTSEGTAVKAAVVKSAVGDSDARGTAQALRRLSERFGLVQKTKGGWKLSRKGVNLVGSIGA